MKRQISTILFTLIIITGCSGIGQFLAKRSWAEDTFNTLSLREKIGQMMLYTMHLSFMNDEDSRWQELKTTIGKDGLGGIHLWSGDIGAALTILNKLQELAKVPIIVDADIEYGLHQRFKAGTDLPPLMAIAATSDLANAYEVARITALEARAVGIHWNFAPVTDVNNNPDNPIINVRSFSEDPDLVSAYALEYIRGLQDHGMFATVKHFPGHGDTKTDTHTGLASIPSDSARLWAVELKPFRAAIAGGVDAVMVAHVSAPDLQPKADFPATMSEYWVTDVLKEQLGFDGIVLTDAMKMGGVTRNFSADYALIQSINAGCDFIIQSHAVIDAIDVVENAVNNGWISVDRINESALKMLRMKEKAGLHENKFISLNHIRSVLGRQEFKTSAAKMAAEAITLVKNEGDILPLKEAVEMIVIDLYDHANDHDESLCTRQLKKIGLKLKTMQIDESDSTDYLLSVLDQIPANSTVIVNAFSMPKAYKNKVALSEMETQFLNALIAKVDKLILVSFGNPYLLRDFPECPVYLCAYKSNAVMQIAAAKALLGQNAISGKLPVTIPGIAPYGTGIGVSKSPLKVELSTASPGQTLHRVMPYEANANVEELRKIFNAAVADSAFPGGVLLASKDGNIFFHEAVGFHTYDQKKNVKSSDIFDLASLTKVVATTAAIMKLVDQKKLDINDRVVEYIPEFGSTYEKSKITIQQLLTHYSGLPADKRYDLNRQSWADVFKTELIAKPGEKHTYSDIGFMILGQIVERISSQSLNEYLDEFIYGPLGMRTTSFNPANPLQRIIPTEFDANGQLIHGVVHDEKARYFGGNTGHAGLFSNARDLALYSQMLLNGGLYGWKRIFSAETVDQYTMLLQDNGELLGWDQPGRFNPFGVYHGGKTFGHTGFTGTSMWIDPDHRMVVILLSNAIHPDREMKAPNYFDWGQRIHSAAYTAVGITVQNAELIWRERWQLELEN